MDKGRARTLTRLRAVVATIIVLVIAGAGITANAAASGKWKALSHFGGEMPYAHGYRSESGTNGFCAFSSKWGPGTPKANPPTVNYKFQYSTSPAADAKFGAVTIPKGTNAYRAAYALNRFGNSTSTQITSAVDYLLWGFSNRAVSAESINKTIAGASPSFISYVQALGRRVEQQAGPYYLYGKILHEGKTARVVDMGLRSGAMAWMESGNNGIGGARLYLNLTNARFKDGTTSKEYYLSGKPEEKNLDIIDPSKPVSMKLEAKNLPGYKINLYNPDNSKYQPLLVGYDTTSMAIDSKADPKVTNPSAQTQTSGFVHNPDGTYSIKDQVTITGGAANTDATTVFDLYYAGTAAPTQQAAIPAGAVKVASISKNVKLGNEGAARFWSDTITLPNTADFGYYTWVATVSGQNMVSYISDYGIPQETGLLQQDQVEVSLRTVSVDEAGDRANIIEAGSKLSDLLIVEDIYDVLPVYPMEVTSTLYGPYLQKPTGSIKADAPVAFTTKTVADKSGEFQTAVSQPLAPGYYVWGYSYPEVVEPTLGTVVYPGKDNKYIYADESSLVRWNPSVHTKADRDYIFSGETNLDHLTLTGGKPNHSYRVVVSAYGPMEQQPTQQANIPKGMQLAFSENIDATTDGNGEFTYSAPEGTFSQSGWYTYRVHVPEGNLSKGYTSDFGIPSETFAVADVVTKASEDVIVGEDFSDTAIVSGAVPNGATMTFDLYRENPGSDVSVDELILTTESINIPGAGEFESPKVKVDKEGRYYFRENLYYPGMDDPKHVGEPRLPGETTRIHKVYTNATISSNVGEPFRDSAFISGDIPENAYLTFEIYKQDDGDDITKDKLIATSDKIYVWGENAKEQTGAATWNPSDNDPGVDLDPCDTLNEEDPTYDEFCSLDTNVEVVPPSPVVIPGENCGDPSKLELPNAIGVDYQVLDSSDFTKVKVVAVAQQGYKFAAETTTAWTFDLTGTTCPTPTPSLPSPVPTASSAATQVDGGAIQTDSGAVQTADGESLVYQAEGEKDLRGLVSGQYGSSHKLETSTQELQIMPRIFADSAKSVDELPVTETDIRPPWASFNVLSPVVSVSQEGNYYARAVYYVDGVKEALYADSQRLPEESTKVSKVVTKATKDAMTGEEIFDTATVTGTLPTGTYLTFDAFHSQKESDPAKFASTNPKPIFTTEKIPVDGPGQYVSNSSGSIFKPEDDGSIFWRYNLYQADGTLISQGKIGDEGETTTVNKPIVPPGGELAKTGVALGIVLLIITTAVVGWLLRNQRTLMKRKHNS